MSDPKHSPVPDARTLAAEHERIGRAAVKIIADYTRTLDAAPVCSTATPAELEELFDEPLPQEGEDIEVIEPTLAQARAMITSGEIIDAKTVILIQYLADRVRETVRG